MASKPEPRMGLWGKLRIRGPGATQAGRPDGEEDEDPGPLAPPGILTFGLRPILTLAQDGPGEWAIMIKKRIKIKTKLF